MITTKEILLLCVTALLVSSCSGGGGAAPALPPVTEYKMTDVKAPANTGVEGGFNYATQQTVAVDIALPYPNGVVTLYETRPLSSIYDTAGNALGTPVVSEPSLLLQGLSSSTVGVDGSYHYRETIVMPITAKTVYLATPARIDVPITNATVTYTFTVGGA